MISESMYAYWNTRSPDDRQEKLIYFNRKFSAGEMREEIGRIAGFLQANGIGKGDAVGLALPNLPAGIFAFYAVNAVGGVANMIHPKISSEMMERQLREADTKILFLYDAVYPMHREMLKRLQIRVILCRVSDRVKGLKRFLIAASERKYPCEYEIRLPKQHFKEINGANDDAAAYIHSGGTGGEPKTAVLTNGNLNALADAIVDTIWRDREPYRDSMLMMLPFFHAFGLGIPMHTVISHIKTVQMPLFRAKEAIRLIRKHGISHLAGVPGMFGKMVNEKNFGGSHLKGIKYVFCGGDGLSEEVRLAFKKKVQAYGGDAEILQGYGLTEASAVVTVSRKEDVRPYSAGQALEGIRLRIAGENGESLPANQVGEIWVCGPTVMKGYLNDPRATEEAMAEAEGARWCRTGDMGYLDEGGQLYFCERKKRSLKISAVNVFPAEIERAAQELQQVKECCAARKTDENGKPYIHLYVHAEKGWEDGSALQEHIASRLNRYSVPKKITFVDEIKRTQIAKVDFLYYESL